MLSFLFMVYRYGSILFSKYNPTQPEGKKDSCAILVKRTAVVL